MSLLARAIRNIECTLTQCVVFMSNLLTAPLRMVLRSILCHHRGPRGKAKREERKEWVRSKEIRDNSFHCSSKRGFSYDVCNILSGNQCILIEF